MKKSRFVNPHIKHTRRGLKDFFLWKMGYFDDEEEKKYEALQPSFRQLGSSVYPEEPTVTWVNHSTFLLQINGVHILTDPIWSERCSPVSFIGPKRRHPPGIAMSELPNIDFVLISHDHYDHLDKMTILELTHRFPRMSWFVPKGVKQWFDRHHISPVYELGWWEHREFFSPKLKGKITAVPAQHFSGRKGYDLNRTLWVGWILEIEMESKIKRCYFVGDTGYNPFDFKKIGEQFAPLDLCMIPIGSYQPKAFMETVHVSPNEAVLIHQEVGSQLSIGMHWKTFRLSDEPMERPPIDLYQALLKQNVDPAKFIILEPGHAINW
jgi:N-acyl-phosphatidylethanolamine-hydrolysing phospholipase D